MKRNLIVIGCVLGVALFLSGRMGGASPGSEAAARADEPRGEEGLEGHDHGSASPGTGEVCEKHNLSIRKCPFCYKENIDALGWCGGHDVPEAVCTRCHPELIEAFKIENDWCAEHELPESQCLICHPDLGKPAEVPASGGTAEESAGARIPRHQRPPSVRCTNNELVVKLASAEVAREAGLEFHTIGERVVRATVVCNAEIAFDGSRYARVAPRAPGIVESVLKDLGERIEAGAALARLDSAEWAAAEGDYLRRKALHELARRNHDRIHDLVTKGVASEQDDLEAETKLEESRIALAQTSQRLRILGQSADGVSRLNEAGEAGSLMEVRAPFAGVVVQRSAVVGEAVEAGQTLFAVADTSRMWALLDVYDADLFSIQVGQPVVFSAAGLSGETFGGRITWMSASVDEKTRTVKARAELENAGGLLRANMFGRAVVTVHEDEKRVVVPKSAVQWDGCCNVVFVRLNDAEYEPRKVRLGYDAGEYLVVKDGLSVGDKIVTQGSFLLKTEILKGSIGAGCCAND